MKTNVKNISLQTRRSGWPLRFVAAALLVGACLTTFTLSAQTNYFLTLSSEPSDLGFATVDPPQPETGYAAGTTVTVTAWPYPTNQFQNWTGSTNSTNNPLVVVVNSDMSLTAHFATAGSPPPTSTNTNSVQIVWQHAHGQLARWFLSGTDFLSAQSYGVTGWDAVEVDDFNGDGLADVVVQHDDGRLGLRLSTNTNSTSIIIGTVNPSWRIVAVADLDGDGDNDILFQHASARLAAWLMNGFTRESTVVLGRVGGSWRVAAVYDYDKDGDQDILFQHGSGQLAVWQMNGDTRNATFVVDSPRQGWRLAAVEDFNGDGKEDFLFQHADGRVAVTYMDGLTRIHSEFLREGRPAAPGWRIVGAE